jgi:hypothetical protein
MNFPRLRLVILMGLLVSVLGGCTHYHYGVREDDWRRMSEQERAEVIRIYQERRLHQERQRAAEAEIRAREMAAHRHHYPEIIYLNLSGGAFIISGQRYSFHQHVFQLRQGETRTLVLVSSHGRYPHRIKIWVRYLDGKVMLGDGRRYLHTVAYRDGWHKGDHYKGIKLRGGVHLDDADLFISSQPLKQMQRKDEYKDRGQPENGRHLRKYEVERLKQERAKQERAKQERAKQERAKQERAKQERVKQERVKQERVKQERAKQERAKQERAKQDKAKQDKSDDGKECIERGKSNGKKKNGIPYCDE